MIAHVDLDVLVYRSGFGCKGDFIQNIELLEGFLQSIYDRVEAESSKLVLSGTSNFRKEIDPNYKASRKSSPKPRYYRELREYAVNELGALVTCDMEADDMLGILQTEDTIICSNDKDLLQIPGWHYRIKKKWADNHMLYVTKEQAVYNFLIQCLTGDTVDDIQGLKGVGPVKAEKAFNKKTKEEMIEITHGLYKKQFGDNWFSEFDRNARLLFIKRYANSEYYDIL